MGFTLHRGFESRPLRFPVLNWTAPAPVAQLDRASVYGTEGQRFESSRARQKTPAQRGFSCFWVVRQIANVSPICPKKGVGCACARAAGTADSSPFGARFSRRPRSRTGLVRQVPAA